MKIRMTDVYQGTVTNNVPWAVGTVHDVPEELAAHIIKIGKAVAVAKSKDKPEKEESES